MNKSGRGMSPDQKRARLILGLMAALVVIIVIGIVWLTVAIGIAWWIGLILAFTVAAAVVLFVLLNMS